MSFYGVTDIWTYLLGAIGIILLPGPNSLFILSVATARGVRPAYRGACGVFLGDLVLLSLVGLGAAGLLRSYPELFIAMKYVGAGYLTWIGSQLLRTALKSVRLEPPADGEMPSLPAHLARPFRRAFVISLLNPKAILFLLSFFVQFIDPTYPEPWLPFLILSAIVMSCSAIYLSVLIFAGARLAESFRRRRHVSGSLSGAVGALFVWFGVKLAGASLA